MNRIDKLFQDRRQNILSVFFTAGYPSSDSTGEIINDLAEAGVNMIEIGMPFSDPLADGPVIQESSKIALKNGMNTGLLFKQLTDIRKKITIPLLLMGYINPVLKFGMENFCANCAETGIDGVILPDLPPEIFLDRYSSLFEKYNLYNIFLITPQSDNERIRMIDKISKGFIYLVSSYSVTGIKEGFTANQISYFNRIKNMTLANPVLIGFGISGRGTFEAACSMANGAIIGSAFIRMLSEKDLSSNNIKQFVNEINLKV